MLLRAQLEKELIDVTTPPHEAAARYAQLVQEYLDIEVSLDDAKHSLMHDVLWEKSAIGRVPVYAHGILYASALHDAMVDRIGSDAEHAALASGVVAPLLNWLRGDVWVHGHIFEKQQELIEAVTKRPLPSSTAPWRRLICARYDTATTSAGHR